MTFDVFGDFETRGYLRNTAKLKNPAAVSEFEHRAFCRNLDGALAYLKSAASLTYEHVCETHRILFQEVYPWAGQDRLATAPNISIAKGRRNDLFAHPKDIRAAADYALKLGQDKPQMSRCPGDVMGYLAHAHPFLDGNGRTILAVHSELAGRAGIRIDWRRTNKTDYLAALTRELDRPGKGELDDYLRPFTHRTQSREGIIETLIDLTAFNPERGPAGKEKITDDLERARQAPSTAQKGKGSDRGRGR